MVKRIFTLNCQDISSIDEFHDEVNNVLCPEINWYGRNWDAFNDILRGGLGSFDSDEEIIIIFKGRKNVVEKLNEGFLQMFIEIVEDFDTIELIIE
ncbi:MAG: barstar family protein [Candidatus Heimdallarchaeota archaeon]|nr:barstar family protein [Candidatus Heimdallarchaeota archaeon]